MTFEDYLLKVRKITQDQAGIELNKARCTINRWAKGKTRPKPKDMGLVHKWSNGRVKLTDWPRGW